MPRVDPLPRESLADHEAGFAAVESVMGFVPNSMVTMARVPGLLPAFQQLAGTVFANGLISPQLGQMIAMVSSVASGCRYCQAHTGHTAERMGIPQAKLADIWNFETSEHFDEAERSALAIASHGGMAPNQVTDEMFERARAHYDDDQLAAIVAMLSLFGWLNRWNDTMATTLESSPTEFGERVISANGWQPGKHA